MCHNSVKKIMIQKITQNSWNFWTVNFIMRAKKLLTSHQIFRYAVPARTVTKKALSTINLLICVIEWKIHLIAVWVPGLVKIIPRHWPRCALVVRWVVCFYTGQTDDWILLVLMSWHRSSQWIFHQEVNEEWTRPLALLCFNFLAGICWISYCSSWIKSCLRLGYYLTEHFP